MRISRLPAAGLAFGVAALLSAPVHAQCPGTEDSFEDNDDCSTAWSLAAGVYPGLYTEAEGIGDEDYFQISVPAGMILTCTATFVHANGDMDLRLFDVGCVTQLDGSFSTTDSEDVTFVNSTGASVDVILKAYVWVNDPNGCNNYDLDVSMVPDPCQSGGDDALEDNDDCGTAIGGIVGSYPGLFVSKTDHDNYAYSLNDGDSIDVNAFFTHALGDIDIILYDAGACGGGLGTGLVQGSSVDDNETLTYTNTSGGAMNVVLEVNVWTSSATDCNSYDLDVQLNGGQGPIGTNVCGPANPNSSGAPAVISAFGTTSALNNDVRLDAASMPTTQFGYFINSMSQGFSNPPGSQGNLCLGGGIGRHSNNVLSTGATGEFSLQLDLTLVPTPGGDVAVQPGETWYWQAWFRDDNPGPTNNFTDGICITFN